MGMDVLGLRRAFVCALMISLGLFTTTYGDCLRLLRPEFEFAIRQEEDYFCGPAVLQSAFLKLGLDRLLQSQSEIAKEIKAEPGEGTSTRQIVIFLKRRGLVAWSKSRATPEEVQKNLEKGHVVIAALLAWGELHWVLIDHWRSPSDSVVEIMDPWGPNRFRKMRKSDFLKSWDLRREGGLLNEIIVIKGLLNDS